MTSRYFIFTLNNPNVSTSEYLEKFYTESKADYLIGQLEKGE